MENNLTLEKQINKEKDKQEENANKKLTNKTYIQKPQKKAFKNYYPSQKKLIKITGEEVFMKPHERGKRASMANFLKDSDNSGGFEYEDYSKCREIIFKIKLKPDEYKFLTKEKKIMENFQHIYLNNVIILF